MDAQPFEPTRNRLGETETWEGEEKKRERGRERASLILRLRLPRGPSLLAPLTTPRSHFLFARQINPPRSGHPAIPRAKRSDLLLFPSLSLSLSLVIPVEAPFDRFPRETSPSRGKRERETGRGSVFHCCHGVLVDTAFIVLIRRFQSRPSWASFI